MTITVSSHRLFLKLVEREQHWVGCNSKKLNRACLYEISVFLYEPGIITTLALPIVVCVFVCDSRAVFLNPFRATEP